METISNAAYESLKKELIECRKDNNLLQLSINVAKEDHQNKLAEISKKLSKVLKTDGDDEMIAELQLHRATIMDHFTLAYMAELELKPSEIKLVQGINSDGYVEMYFVKNSLILMPGE